MPRILKVAENRKSCPKSQKLPKSCRATCGWAYCLDSFMINNSFQRYPVIDFRLKIQTHVKVNLWLLCLFIKNNTRLLSGRHLVSKTERYMGRIAVFLYLYIASMSRAKVAFKFCHNCNKQGFLTSLAFKADVI